MNSYPWSFSRFKLITIWSILENITYPLNISLEKSFKLAFIFFIFIEFDEKLSLNPFVNLLKSFFNESNYKLIESPLNKLGLFSHNPSIYINFAFG